MSKILRRKELAHIFEELGLDNISDIITKVKKIFYKYSFESDSNYVICGRRELLIEEAIGVINGEEDFCKSNLLKSINDRVRFSIGNIYELTYGDSYPYQYRHETRKVVDGSEITKLRECDNLYLQKGIVSLEEKNVIEDLINRLENLYKQEKKLVFDAFHGGYMGPSHYYYIRENIANNKYEFKYGYSKSGAVIFENAIGENIKVIDRNENEYKEFINELLGIVKKWEKDYLNSDILDGTQWHINSFENSMEYSGDNDFPSDYENAIRIINKYFGVEDNEKYEAKAACLDDVISLKMQDPFWGYLVKEYLKNNFESEVAAKKCFEHIAKYDDILNEFALYLVHKNYEYLTKFNVEGYTAKDIYELNPSLKPTGVFSFMTSLRDDPEWAKDIIKKGFSNKDVIPPVSPKSAIVINEYYMDENGHEIDRQRNIDFISPKEIAKVNKDDWKTSDMPEQYEMFILDKLLSEKEIEILKNGHKPEAMEDKWFWYAESNKLYIHRSWTGFCIYVVELNTSGHLNVIVNRNMEQYKNTDIEEDKNTLSNLLEHWKTDNFNHYDLFIEETYKAVLKQEENSDKAVEEINNYSENKE